MDFVIDNKSLIELYTTGKSRKLHFPKGIAQKFVERVSRIKAAMNIDDLRKPPSMKFEKLQGHADLYSIRLNQQYRLIFQFTSVDKDIKTGKILIRDIWDHSKKY